jgi:Fic family protein
LGDILYIVDVDRLRTSPIGQLVRIQGTDARTGDYDYFAFVPDDLGEHVALATPTWTSVAHAMEGLGRLRQACAQLPNPRLLIAPALVQEALTTSALEGTYGELPDVLEARLPQRGAPSAEVGEIRAYEAMANKAFDWMKDRPITVGVLSDLQGMLAERSRRPPKDPGRVREHQVFIGPEGSAVNDARFVPPPPGMQLRGGLQAWQDWINADHDLPVVVTCALAHYQFETLHPFGDGNGRIGRLVFILQLLRSGVLPEPGLTISPWLLKRRTEYQDTLLNTSTTGDWNPLVVFFARAIQDQCNAHVAIAQQVLDWFAETRQALADRRWSGVIAKIVEDLIDRPVITAGSVAEQYETSAPSAHHAIDRLVGIGVLEELTGRSYGRVFGARQVLELVESL